MCWKTERMLLRVFPLDSQKNETDANQLIYIYVAIIMIIINIHVCIFKQ